MRLYSGSSRQLIQDTYQNQIADKLRLSFFEYYGFYPSISEINSWRNSLRALTLVFEESKLDDHGVMLEYQLPLSSRRLDCLVCGKDSERKENAVIIELKQWDACEQADGENEVLTWMGGAKREILHPSVQVGQYKMYLEDTHTAFYEGPNPISLNACAYLHNYSYCDGDVLVAPKFRNAVQRFPLFTADDVSKLSEHLCQKLLKGEGLEILKRVEESRYRPCKKLMDHVGNVIKGKSEYILLDEQLVVYDKVFACTKKGFHDKEKTVLLIHGGPGTGKSVIAINLMADLLLQGYNAHYATGSKTFTETLRKIIGSRGSVQFKYFNSYSDAQSNEIDVLIADESHRIRETSNSRFTPKTKRSNLPQIEELFKASKVLVFLIDDKQIVRPNEIGSTSYIKRYVAKHNAKTYEYELEAQFRCNGSEAFVNWVNNTLGIQRTANVIWNTDEEFDFKIFSNPFDLVNTIREKAEEGFTARTAAGFCWPWSDPKPDGTLVNDVKIGSFEMPWEKKTKFWEWATDKSGLDQIGTVYTSQGFEFDYMGVIFANDLVYDPETASWKGIRENSSDSVVRRSGERFVDYMKNTYRVLLTRGMKGCYVYFMDKNTENFFKSRIESRESLAAKEVPAEPLVSAAEIDTFLREVLSDEDVPAKEKFTTYLPVYSLEAAASGFGKEEYVENLGWKRVNIRQKLNQDMFIAKVVGKSMEPTIPDGSYCIFRRDKGGTRNGLVVLVESNRIKDPENGQRFTVKRYHSEKVFFDDGTWRHKKLILSPDNKEFKDIVLEDVFPGDFRVVADFGTTISSGVPASTGKDK